MATATVPTPENWAIIKDEIEHAHRDLEAIRAAFEVVDELIDRGDARLIRLGLLIKAPGTRQ